MDEPKLRGVNLGGWLVLERWMAPAVFEGTEAQDEYSLMSTTVGKERIERHRATFITEQDFIWLAEHGVNAVRVPVGYWIFDGDGPYMPGIEYLDFAFVMAEKYHMNVLIDLHGGGGSQNGKDHSGRIGKAGWFDTPAYQQETIDILERLATRYVDSTAFWGIELLNEPAIGLRRLFTLRKFYNDAYHRLVQVVRPGTRIVFSDGYLPNFFTGAVRPKEGFPVVMDIHWYNLGIFPLPWYFALLAKRPGSIRRFGRRQPVVIGEWSGMLSYRKLKKLPEEERERLQKEHLVRQLEAYKGASGWFYWSYKTEQPGIWNFRSLVEGGDISLQ